MRDLLNGQFPNFYQLVVGITVDVALRYFFLVGIAWLLAYVLFRRRWFHRKIIASFPKSGEVGREIAYSLLSIFIFGVIGAATITAKMKMERSEYPISRHTSPDLGNEAMIFR